MSNPCPVCGHVDSACTGDTRTRQIITSNGVHNVTGLPRVPKQSKRIGVPGYVGRVELYDPKAPNIRFVQPEEAEIAVESGEIAAAVEAATAAPASLAPAGDKGAAPKRTRKPK